MGTLGETTSKRLAAVIQQANGPSGGRVPHAAGAKYYGGFGGAAGTWGRVPTGRGGMPQQPLSALHRNVPASSQTGRRLRVRPNAEGTKSLWDTLPEKPLPNAPAKGSSPAAGTPRPHTAKCRGATSRAGTSVVPQELAFGDASSSPGPGGLKAGKLARPQSALTHQRPAAPLGAQTKCASALKGGPEAIMSALSCGMTSALPAIYPSAAAGMEARSQSGTSVCDAQTADVTRGSGEEQGMGLNVAGPGHLLEQLRQAVRKARTVYEGEHALVEKACMAVEDGSGVLDAPACVQVFGCIGVQTSAADAQALIHAHAGGPNFTCAALTTLLLSDPSRLLAAELPCRKGAFVAGELAAGVRECKVVYPQSKTPVFTPSSWSQAGVGAACVARSSEVPEMRLQLECVYGYDGVSNTASNIFYNCQRQLVYYTAAVVVIYAPAASAAAEALPGAAVESHTQRFFLGHDDDIKALAPCQAAVSVDGQQYPASSVFASGQVTRSTHGPYVCIWDSRSSSPTTDGELRRLHLGKDARGVCALAFSPDGRNLVVVTMDTSHTVLVYDWRARRVLSSGRGYAGEPTQVYGALWNPFLAEAKVAEFVTYGRKHCKLWTQQPPSPRGKPPAHAGWTPFQLSFGSFDVQNVHSAAFLPATLALVLGLARGELLIVERGKAVRSIPAHRPGSQTIGGDGCITYSGLRGMSLALGNTMLVTAGADGYVHTWDVRDGTLAEADKLRSTRLAPVYQLGPGEKAPAARALATDPATDAIVLGTAGCDIVELGEMRQDVLVHGQAGALHAVAWHPVRHAVFATASEAPRVFVCDATSRVVIKTAATGFAARACAWSQRPLGGLGHHLCLGGADGRLVVLDEETLASVWQGRDSHRGVADVKYSPSGHALAAATMERHIDIYRTGEARYTRVARCRGHSSVVRHVDWSADGAALRSACSAYELLHWDSRSGKQLAASARDVEWATWTCTLGFPMLGIWPADSDGTDINAADRHPSGALVATADDSGVVKLFNCPCVVEDAPHRAYSGHSAHVTCLRFSADGRRLVSVGGADRSAFQFRLVPVQQPPPPAAPPPASWGTVDGKVYGWTTCLPPQTGDVVASVDSPCAFPHSHGSCVGESQGAHVGAGGGSTSVCGEVQEPAQDDAENDGNDSTGGW